MSKYSTKTISREEAINMVRRCRLRNIPDEVSNLSDEELEEELNRYAYDNNGYSYSDILGFLYNFNIKQ